MKATVGWTLFGVALILSATLARYAAPLAVGRISSRFGYRTRNGRVELHNGIDIAAPTGTPVLAVGNGEVIATGTTARGGLQLFLLLDSGMVAGYAHLQNYTVREGRVKRGDQIATVGTTGTTTGPHLHFTLRDRSDKYVDPLNFIKWPNA
jgi:murein DD-endopeptidase MepM/ murein hydrolase activator NlpD